MAENVIQGAHVHHISVGLAPPANQTDPRAAALAVPSVDPSPPTAPVAPPPPVSAPVSTPVGVAVSVPVNANAPAPAHMTAPVATSLVAPAGVNPTTTMVPVAPLDPSQPTCFPPLEDFAEDLDLRLGRANGNIYHRRPGIDGVHDGQIMVRLKKKRFIVIDYGIVPSARDVAAAAVNPNVGCPPGAGKQKCITPECPKRGVPVLLYDSDPNEPTSLYLRSGLCFTCQRVLNEKRRTQRKRKSEAMGGHHRPDPHGAGPGGLGGHHYHPHGAPLDHTHIPPTGAGDPTGYHTDAKRFRLNGEIIDLSPDAIIINGPLDGTRHHGPGYGFSEIGVDLKIIASEVSRVTDQLVEGATAHLCSSPTGTPGSDPGSTNAAEQSTDVMAVAAAAAAAAAVAAAGSTAESSNVDEAVSAAMDASGLLTGKTENSTTLTKEVGTPGSVGVPFQQPVSESAAVPPSAISNEEILSLYERAFLSMSKGIFLLSQWRASWDAHAAEDAARRAALEVPHVTVPNVGDPAAADAVAAAAAAAAVVGVANVAAVSVPASAAPLPDSIGSPTHVSAPHNAGEMAAVAASAPVGGLPGHHTLDGPQMSAITPQPRHEEGVPNGPNGSEKPSNMIPLLLAAEQKDAKEEAMVTTVLTSSSTALEQQGPCGGSEQAVKNDPAVI